MAKDAVAIRKFDGMSTATSKEDKPITVLTELVNLRPARKVGRAIKRPSYENKLTSGLTSLSTMKEFTDKNDETVLLLVDGNTIERSVNTAGSYAAIASVTNDDRTAGSTVDGTAVNPIVVNKELRSGAGTGATERPFWFGYVPARNRFNDTVTISAGRYLEDQEYKTLLESLISVKISKDTVNVVMKTDAGLDLGYYTVYASAVVDGYQRTHPTNEPTFTNSEPLAVKHVNVDAASTTINITVRVTAANASAAKRITAIDLFVAYASDTGESYSSSTAYFLERVDLNADGESFLEISGDVGTTNADKITITPATDWQSFYPSGMFIYDATNDNYYQALSADATRTIIDTSPNAAADGTATLRFFSRWYVDGATDNAYVTFYDNDLKKLGAEMYSYLNLQVNDVGITGTDFRYKYAAYNGSRVLYGGFPDDNFTYFSVADRPDIVPALNIVRHQYTVKGIASAGRDFYVFSDRNAERVSIYSSNEAEQDSEFLNVGAVSHRAIVAPSDEVVAVMTYKGPMLISNRRPIEIGKHLNDWWLSTFTKAQMEACVAGYNHMNDEIIFSFPTYATSPYTTGIVFVFDMNAWREQTALSPWWILKTDAAIKAMDLNNQLHLIGGMATKIVDFDSASGTETVSTSYKMKMLQGPIPNKEVRWDRLYVDVETSDTVTGALYYDGSASSVSLTLNTDLNGFIRYLSKTLEVELTTAASTNSVEHKGMLLTFTPKRV